MKKLYLLFYWCCSSLVLSAQVNADSLWRIWDDAGQSDTVRLKALQDMAWSMMYSNPDSTELLGKAELDFARSIGSRKWQGKALNVIGGAYHVKGKYPTALNYYQKALAALQEAGELKSVAAMLNNIGLIYRDQGNSLKAVQYYGKYLSIGEALGDNDILSSAYNNLGTIYSDQGNYDKAFEYYEKGLQLAEKLVDKEGMAIGHNNIGSVYYAQQKYDLALDRYTKSLTLREAIDDQRGSALVYNNIGLIYKGQGRLRQSLACFQKAITIQEEMGDSPGLANTCCNIGLVYNRQNKYASAIKWCKRGESVSRQIGALRPERNACECLYEAYKGMGQKGDALEWHEQYVALDDSLKKEETGKRLEQMEFAKQLLTDSLGRAEKTLEMEVAFRDKAREKDRIVHILLISGIVVLALALTFWSRMLYFRQHSQKLQHKTDYLEKQQLLNEIALLKTQVNPHFLFNSLSILASLVRVNPDLSEQFIDQLSRSYRYILEQKEQPLVSLRTELEFIRSYAFLLKIRFENKFDLQFDLPDAVLDQYKIAPLTLQLLIENAVKHNRMSRKDPLIVAVSLDNNQTLLVKNRLQARSTASASTGLGLQNILNRYALLTNRPVWAGEREDFFVVKIPLLA